MSNSALEGIGRSGPFSVMSPPGVVGGRQSTISQPSGDVKAGERARTLVGSGIALCREPLLRLHRRALGALAVAARMQHRREIEECVTTLVREVAPRGELDDGAGFPACLLRRS